MRHVYDAAIAPVKAFTPYCVAGPSPLVITGVTMEVLPSLDSSNLISMVEGLKTNF